MSSAALERQLATIPLASLRAFVLAARLLSFKQASLALGVTPAAVSQQIATLEAYLGRRLFRRLNRTIALTEAGKTLFSEIDGALDVLAAAAARQRASPRSSRRRKLSVTAAPAFASKWLVPRLHGFQSERPGFDVSIHAEDATADLDVDERYDIAIRYGDRPAGTGLHIEPLWEEPHSIVAVSSPSLAREMFRASPKASSHPWPLLRVLPPEDTRHAADHQAALPAYADWLRFFAANGVSEAAVNAAINRSITLNSTQTALEAAYLGKGLALCPNVLVMEDIAARRLVKPFTVDVKDCWRYWIVCRKPSIEELPIRPFLTWLRQQARAVSV